MQNILLKLNSSDVYNITEIEEQYSDNSESTNGLFISMLGNINSFSDLVKIFKTSNPAVNSGSDILGVSGINIIRNPSYDDSVSGNNGITAGTIEEVDASNDQDEIIIGDFVVNSNDPDDYEIGEFDAKVFVKGFTE